MDNFLIAKATDVGVTRQINEDSMTVFESPNGTVLAVFDGMGGQAAGDVASKMSAEIIESILTDNTFITPEEAIRYSINAANQGVLRKTEQNPELEGMGSTCVMLIIKDGYVSCGWVGDSRIYYIANHTIRQLSHDQSYVQQLLDSGQITPTEALNHPQKNEITNCIGLQNMSAPETIAAPIAPEAGSVFLLCTDGLSGLVDEKQIENVVSDTSMSLQQKADKLVNMANDAGGLDNITVELVQFGKPESAHGQNGSMADNKLNVKKKRIDRILYYTVAFILLGVIFLSGRYYFLNQKSPKSDNTTKTTSPTKTSVKSESIRIETSDRVSSSRQPETKPQSPNKKNDVKLPIKGKKDDTRIQRQITTGKKDEKPSIPPKIEEPAVGNYTGNDK